MASADGSALTSHKSGRKSILSAGPPDDDDEKIVFLVNSCRSSSVLTPPAPRKPWKWKSQRSPNRLHPHHRNWRVRRILQSIRRYHHFAWSNKSFLVQALRFSCFCIEKLSIETLPHSIYVRYSNWFRMEGLHVQSFWFNHRFSGYKVISNIGRGCLSSRKFLGLFSLQRNVM